MTKKENKTILSFNKVIGIALLLVLLLGVVRYYRAEASSRLFAHHFSTEAIPLEYLRGASAKDPNLSAALSFYSDRDFTEAIPLFTKYLSKKPADFDAHFLKGISLLETGRYDEAIRVFKTVRINSEHHYEDATWYLALTYLKKDQKDDAKVILKELNATTGNSKIEAAKKLLSEIS